MDKTELYGRLLLDTELTMELRRSLIDQAQPAVVQQENYIECQRCLSKTRKEQAMLPNGTYYCPQCILLGRVSSTNQLYHLSEPNLFAKLTQTPLTWQGQLSSFQQNCSKELIKALDRPGKYLMWAVTGAGKTEMLFPTLTKALLQKKRICLASPRVDVCNELYPRIVAAFHKITPVLLHGHSKQPYQYSQLTICTTHQLLRFQHAFDLLIIDEVDAFPFVNSQMLKNAAKKAMKISGTLVYLTATPTKKMLVHIKQNKLPVSYLPIRFHRKLLPVPQVWLMNHWQNKLAKQKLPLKLTNCLRKWSKDALPFLVFVPNIELLKPVLQVLRSVLPKNVLGDSVYSADPQRITKVQAMRDHQLNYLVTTTILERGVTFPSLNVMILGADERTFSVSALVQIAGRVGRSQKRPYGDVIFICQDYVKNVKEAVQQIKGLNKKGDKLLDE
ncbi:MAG TPA: DEAD/DEAH box helicase family protein [Candidatus Ligilactobacillus excrementavium]|nr:DEAD/DEAH box helicase family protein [Candidatus Ligilactobacillus excrementavium]